MSMTIHDRGNSYCSTSPVTVEDTQCLSKFYKKNEEYRDIESEYEGCESLNTKIHVYTGDITEFSVDAIVCSVQTLLTAKPYGMHGAVLRRAGEVYEETVRNVGYCKAGQAFITDGFELYAKHVIHTAGPPPDSTLTYDERKSCLEKSYLSCLDIVGASQDITTVAFPCLGCGGGGLELIDAIMTAVTTIRQWLETDHNLTQVNSIILVMYDEYQWNKYRQQLTRVFPYGKDLAGIDWETLNYADERTLTSFVPQTWHTTNILCYQYKKHAVKPVSKHFHRIVDQLHKEFGTRSKPPERFKNCGRIFINSGGKFLVVYHGENSCTIEIQISSSTLDNFDWNICSNVQLLISNYLTSNLENVTRYKTYIRCENSSWGDKDGLISKEKIQRKISRNSTIQCKHKKSANNVSHSVDINEITKFWIHQDQGTFHREPLEHNERAEESEESSSWQSLSSIPGLQNNTEHKQHNITMAIRASACTPVEHFDDSPSTITSNVPTCTASDTEGDRLSSSYQPLNDSLLPTSCQQGTCEKDIRTKTHFQHFGTTSLHAWKPGTEMESGNQAQEPSVYSKNFGERQYNTSTGQDCKSSTKKQKSSNYNECEKCDYGSGQIRNEAKSSSSFCDLNLDSLAGACGGGNHVYKSQSNIRYSSVIASLNDQALIQLARLVGNKDTQLGLELGLQYSCIQRIKSHNSDDAVVQAYHILRQWKIQQRGKAAIETLAEAMTNCSIDTSSLYM